MCFLSTTCTLEGVLECVSPTQPPFFSKGLSQSFYFSYSLCKLSLLSKWRVFVWPGISTENSWNAYASLQEAQKRMKIKSPPRILALHLKRFKYIEQLGRYKKLSYRVVFPLELKLCNTTDDAPGSEAEYSLFAVVVHVGSGPNHGHYVSLVKSHNHWLFFDDENVEIIDESVVQTFFGSTQEYSNNTDHGYILFYESLDPKHWHLEILTQEFILRKTPFLQLFLHTFLRNTMATLFVHGKINSRVLLRSESGWDELHGKLVLTDIVLLESYWRRR